MGVLKLATGTSPADIRKEVERREQILNSQHTEYQFKMQNLYTHTEQTFFRGSAVDARLVYALLVLVLLGVPAISISGLMNAQMQSRLSEIAIRKAYGASNVSIIGHLFTEGLVNTLIGGVLGFLLSYVLVSLGRVWLLGDGINNLSGISVDMGMLFRPDLFIIVLLVCLVFNLMAVLLPATLAVRKNIVVTLKGGE
jgi:putative ABC transport system permease protein